jgi:dienelactone hydrolase
MYLWNKKQILRSRLYILIPVVLGFIVSAAWAQQTPADASKGATPSSATATPALAPDQQTPKIPKPAPAIDPLTGIPLYETIQEDWSSLQIGVSQLKPEPPLVGEVDDSQAKFTRTLVSVKWRPGDAIDLWVIVPKGVKKAPAALYLYNFTEELTRFRSNDWCARVTSGGVAAIGFTSALSGPRFHDRPMKQWFVSELQESIGSTVHDVHFILDYLAQRGDIDMDHVGMFGEGSGGAIAILAAAADPRIKAVDALDPWGDWPDFLAESAMVQEDPHHADYVKPEFLKQVAPLDPVKWLPQLKVPIRIQQVHQNDAVPDKCKDAIKAAAPKQAEVDRFEAANTLAMHESGGRVFDWIKAQLQPPPVKPGTENKTAVLQQGSAVQNASPAHP